MYTSTNKKVVIGLSGGVDSSVSAYLLKKQGYDVYGVFFIMSDLHLNMVEDSKKCAEFLDIPLTVLDLREKFKENIIKPFADMYNNGKTPNPCVICNPLIKFSSMLKFSKENNIEHIATGHYANIIYKNGRYSLKTPEANKKDQTYMLYGLGQDVLKKLIFPLNAFKVKSDVRKLAAEIGLFTAKKPDSQDICFIEDNDYASYIENFLGKKSKIGNFIAPNGDIVGKHKGIVHYTVGQRKGLGVALGKPCFVKNINEFSGDILLAFDGDNTTKQVELKNINYMLIDSIKCGEKVYAKLRSTAVPVECIANLLDNNNVILKFSTEQKLPSYGQAGVVYNNDNVLLFGGTIT